MKYFCYLFLLFVTIACKKTGSNLPSFEGLWIEKSLRLDSIDFKNEFSSSDNNKFDFNLKSQPYKDTSQNPDYPINHSALYSYYLEGNYIFLYNFLSSSSVYNKYDFELSADRKSFTVKRFYSRNNLPGLIEFERLK